MVSRDALKAGLAALTVAGCMAVPATAGAVNAQVADDFVIGVGASYAVGSVEVDGLYDFGGGPVTGMNVRIYTNSGTNLPQEPPIFSQTGITPTNGLAGPDFVIPVSGAPVLTTGVYWISVQAQLAGYPDNVWDWVNRPQQGGTNPAAFQGPDGTLPTCATWAVRSSVGCPGFPAVPDQTFTIRDTGGTAVWNQLDMPAATGVFSQIDPPTPPPPGGGGGAVTPTPTPTTTPKKCKKGQKLKKGKCVKKKRKMKK